MAEVDVVGMSIVERRASCEGRDDCWSCGIDDDDSVDVDGDDNHDLLDTFRNFDLPDLQ